MGFMPMLCIQLFMESLMLECMLGGARATGGVTGPGPATTQKAYVSDTGESTSYYGLLTPDEMITGSALCTMFGFTSSGNNPNWAKFEVDGKILFWPLLTLATGIAWTTFYSKGIVFGVNGNGPQSVVAGVNQYKTITVKGRTFLIRLPSISNNYPWAAQADIKPSEWGRMMQSVDKNTNATSPDGSKWASLDLGIPGKHCMVQQLNSNQSNAMCIGYESVLTASSLGRDSGNPNVGWRPVLELVG